LVLVDVKDLEAAETRILFNHVVADVHGLVVGMPNASFDIGQVQLVLPFSKPLSLRINRSSIIIF
jgi:hypothetical protein